MTRAFTSRRGRALASTTAATGLVLGALTMSSGSAQSAEPAPDCATAVDYTTLAEGDTVTALSVTSGTVPEEFTGTVLGVIDDGIAVGVDMIMIDFGDDDPTSSMAKAGGIWQGMSGSPVYVGDPADGNIVGAIAYGLSYGPSPIAGVTPYSDMDDYLGSAKPTTTITVDGSQARTIAQHSDASRAQAAQGFRQLRMPVGVNGVDPSRFAKAQKYARKHDLGYLSRGTFATGGAGRASSATEDDLVAGGNLAASISYGDVTMAGVGTATSVCDGKVVGFGHPMMFSGDTELGLNPASAVYIQPDSAYAPFKVANISPAVGTITDDRLTGITGNFASVPDGGTVTSSVSYAGRSRTGSSDIYYTPYSADVTFSELIANHDRVIDGIIPGTEDLGFTVAGTDETGQPFSISFDDTYVSQYDITFESIWDVADLVYVLSNLPDVDVTSITTDGTVTDDVDRLKVNAVEQFRDGEWTKIGRRGSAKIKPGQMLKVRAVLKAADGTLSYVPFSTRIAKTARSGYLYVSGGLNDYTDVYGAKSVADVEEAYAKASKNSDVVFQLRMKGNGGRLTDAEAQDGGVVSGGKYLSVNVGGSKAGGGVYECRRGC